jgi:hypothetical protein
VHRRGESDKAGSHGGGGGGVYGERTGLRTEADDVGRRHFRRRRYVRSYRNC